MKLLQFLYYGRISYKTINVIEPTSIDGQVYPTDCALVIGYIYGFCTFTESLLLFQVKTITLQIDTHK